MSVHRIGSAVPYKDVAATLRRIADDIEAGREVNEAVVVTLGAELAVYGLGAGDSGSAHMLLALAQRYLENQVTVKLKT